MFGLLCKTKTRMIFHCFLGSQANLGIAVITIFGDEKAHLAVLSIHVLDVHNGYIVFTHL